MDSSKPRAFGFIFARGGSKGLPGKNIKPLASKPLIAHAIEMGKACAYLETVIVSTDDPAIAAVAREYGAEVPFMRPDELSADNSPEWLAWQHAIRWVQANRGEFDTFVSLPATAPLRALEDVTACIDTLWADPAADAVITVRAAERSPYFNMVKLDSNGYAHPVIECSPPIMRRQDAPEVFDLTTVAYAVRPAFVFRCSSLFEGNVKAVVVPAERALDIDTAYDFRIAECMARNSRT